MAFKVIPKRLLHDRIFIIGDNREAVSNGHWMVARGHLHPKDKDRLADTGKARAYLPGATVKAVIGPAGAQSLGYMARPENGTVYARTSLMVAEDECGYHSRVFRNEETGALLYLRQEYVEFFGIKSVESAKPDGPAWFGPGALMPVVSYGLPEWCRAEEPARA